MIFARRAPRVQTGIDCCGFAATYNNNSKIVIYNNLHSN